MCKGEKLGLCGVGWPRPGHSPFSTPMYFYAPSGFVAGSTLSVPSMVLGLICFCRDQNELVTNDAQCRSRRRRSALPCVPPLTVKETLVHQLNYPQISPDFASGGSFVNQSRIYMRAECTPFKNNVCLNAALLMHILALLASILP